MTSKIQPGVKSLREILQLTENEIDEDPAVLLTTLITTAVHDKEPAHSLRAIFEAVKQSSSSSSVESLTIIPIVVGNMTDGADDFMDLMARECSAKEVVMAVEEVVETLDRRLQSEDDEGEDDEHRLTPIMQIVRLVRAYMIAIPRLPHWTKSPAAAVGSRISELEAVIGLASRDASAEEGCMLITAVSQLGISLNEGADQTAKDLLRHLVEVTVNDLAKCVNDGLAKKAFAAHFSRLVVPHASIADPGPHEDSLTSTWVALRALGATTTLYESAPSPLSFVLLAHDPTYTFSIPTLTKFYPIVLSSIQLNVSLDEVLSVLISSLAPLRSASPRPELDADLIIPLAHLLPHVAASHSEPNVRHYTFRVISLILGLSPSPLRFELLQELLIDEDLPPQMRVAAVGLLKEATLEGLAATDKNIFASPLLLSTFGPIVLQPSPPTLFDSVQLDDFLDSAEPLRLVECLGFYYVLLMRDTQNKTGVRDADALDNVQHTLLRPLRGGLETWNGDLAADALGEIDHDSALQLGILSMWLERVQGSIDGITT